MSNRNRDYQNYYGKREPKEAIESTEPQAEETTVTKMPEEVPEEANQPVEEENHVEAPTAEILPAKLVVTGAARVNVRVGHSKNAQVITVLPEGAEITFLDITPDGWDKVMLKDGTEGYMMSKFLKRI